MVWRVLLDGTSPDRLLSSDILSKELRTPGKAIESEYDASIDNFARCFDECKSIEDNLYTWAIQSICKIPSSITNGNLERLGSLLFGLTIKRDPNSRAKGFEEILNVFNSYTTTGPEVNKSLAFSLFLFERGKRTDVWVDFNHFPSQILNKMRN